MKITYKKRYKELSSKLSKESGIININRIQKTSDIHQEVVTTILERLDLFEQNKKYLYPKLSLNSLAKQLQTNPNYLSRVINLKREKNFSQYINELRIDYALKELKINTKFRKYSIKAIAAECGYKNATSFSKAFYKHTGLHPSFYIKQLEKEIV